MNATAPPPPHTWKQWPRVRVLGFLAATWAVNEAVNLFGFWHWNISLGVLFTAYWILPRPHWPWLTLSIIFGHMFRGAVLIEGMPYRPDLFLGFWHSFIQFAMGNLLTPFVVMAGVEILVDRREADHRGGGDATLRNLLLAALVTATWQTLKDCVYVMDDGQVGDVRLGRIVDLVPLGGADTGVLLLQFGFAHFMGAFIGVLLVAPFALWWRSRSDYADNRTVVRDASGLLPIMGLFILSPHWVSVPGLRGLDLPHLEEIIRLLLLASVIVYALRHGWRGALLATVAASVAIALKDHGGLAKVAPWLLQAFVAVAGATGLLFGAMVDDNRRQTRAIRDSDDSHARLNQALARAATANLERETAERHRIAGALHDDLGQSLTAFQTHLRLLRPAFERVGRLDVLDAINTMSTGLRENVRGVIERLRPAALDQLGLYGALDAGAMRVAAEDAGLAYSVELLGDARLLPTLHDTLRVAAYRLVQECVFNAIKHAGARTLRVRMRVEQRSHHVCLFLDVRDDGRGQASEMPRIGGLSAIHDQVTALGGSLHVQTLSPGVRIHALLPQSVHE